MKINSLHIDNFGKFKDFSIDFTDKLNIIYGENEYGKTTIMSFIKLMFYADSSKSRDILKNLRLKYKPKHAGKMAGNITFEHEGLKYRIERTFGNTPRQDVVNLINLTTGRKMDLEDPINVGEGFFHLSKSGFEKSIFIGQFGGSIATEKESEEFTAKLSALAMGGSSVASVPQALEKIQKEKEKYLSKNHKVGKSDKLKIELETLKADLVLAKRNEEEYLQLKNRQKDKEQEIRELQKENKKYDKYLSLSERINEMQAIENDINILQKINLLKNRIKSKESELKRNNTVADEDFIQNVKDKLATIASLKNSVRTANEYIQKLDDDINQIDNKLKYRDNQQLKDESEKLIKEIKNAEKILETKKETYDSTLKETYEAKTEMLLEKRLFNSEKNNPETSKNTSSAAIFLLGLLMFIVGILLGIFFNPVCFIVAFTGIVAVIVMAPKLKAEPNDNEEIDFGIKDTQGTTKNTIKDKELKYNKLKSNCDVLKSQIDKLNDYLDSHRTMLNDITREKHDSEMNLTELYAQKSTKSDEMFKQKKTINKIESTIVGIKEELFNIYNRFEYTSNVDKISSSVAKLEAKLKNLNELKLQLKYQEEAFNGKESDMEENIAKLNQFKGFMEKHNIQVDSIPSPQSLREKIRQNELSIEKLRDEYNEIVTEGLIKIENKKGVYEVEEQIKELSAELKRQEEICKTYDIALEVLQRTDFELRSCFTPKLNDRVRDILAKFVDNEYEEILISKDMDINIKPKNEQTLNWKYLSNGTIDQLYFALRVALSSLMTENKEPLPLILDDIFLQYDEKRAKNAMKFLKEYSETTQILFFTCRRSMSEVPVKEEAKKTVNNTNNIYKERNYSYKKNKGNRNRKKYN